MTAPTLAECQEAFSSDEYMIGSGRERRGYHIPGSKWVYKQEIYPRKRANEREFVRYQEMIDNPHKPVDLHFPEMHMLENGVIAAEYIPGDRPTRCPWSEHEQHENDGTRCWATILDEFCDVFGLYDSAAACNVRVVEQSDGSHKVYVIDLAE